MIFTCYGEKQCYAEALALVGKIPTSSYVIGCSNRHSRSSTLYFYRFPKNCERRRLWLAFVCWQNQDGTPWEQGHGNRVCSEHFLSGSKSDAPTDPDYVPSVKAGIEKNKDCSSSGAAVRARFQRAQRRSIAAHTAMVEAEAIEKQLRWLVTTAKHDHGGLARNDSERVGDVIAKPVGHSELTTTCTCENVTISAEIGGCL